MQAHIVRESHLPNGRHIHAVVQYNHRMNQTLHIEAEQCFIPPNNPLVASAPANGPVIAGNTHPSASSSNASPSPTPTTTSTTASFFDDDLEMSDEEEMPSASLASPGLTQRMQDTATPSSASSPLPSVPVLSDVEMEDSSEEEEPSANAITFHALAQRFATLEAQNARLQGQLDSRNASVHVQLQAQMAWFEDEIEAQSVEYQELLEHEEMQRRELETRILALEATSGSAQINS